MSTAPTAPTPWYRRTWVIVVGVVIVALIVIGAVAGSSGGGDSSNAMEKSILNDGSTQLQANVANLVPGATATVDDAHCIKTAGTQDYTCLVHYTVTDNGQHQKFSLDVSGTCNSDGECQWHATGDGQPVAG